MWFIFPCWGKKGTKQKTNQTKANKQTNQKPPEQTKTNKSKEVPNPLVTGMRSSMGNSVGLSYFGEIGKKGKSESSTEFLLNCRVEMFL